MTYASSTFVVTLGKLNVRPTEWTPTVNGRATGSFIEKVNFSPVTNGWFGI